MPLGADNIEAARPIALRLKFSTSGADRRSLGNTFRHPAPMDRIHGRRATRHCRPAEYRWPRPAILVAMVIAPARPPPQQYGLLFMESGRSARQNGVTACRDLAAA